MRLRDVKQSVFPIFFPLGRRFGKHPPIKGIPRSLPSSRLAFASAATNASLLN